MWVYKDRVGIDKLYIIDNDTVDVLTSQKRIVYHPRLKGNYMRTRTILSTLVLCVTALKSNEGPDFKLTNSLQTPVKINVSYQDGSSQTITDILVPKDSATIKSKRYGKPISHIEITALSGQSSQPQQAQPQQAQPQQAKPPFFQPTSEQIRQAQDNIRGGYDPRYLPTESGM